MNDLIVRLNEVLAQGRPVVAATIVTNEGSTPRTAGSKMLIFDDGAIAGTVGGGLSEGLVMAAAPEIFSTGQARLMDFDMTGQAQKGADLICGGKMRVFLERVDPDPATRALFATLAERLEAGERCLLVTPLSESTGVASLSGRCLLFPGGRMGHHPGDTALEEAKRQGRGIMAPILIKSNGQTYFLEPALTQDPLFLCGGGHVSRPTAQIAAMVGFRVTVLDDRQEFANPERFPFAAETAAISPETGWLAGRTIGEDASIVIVTRGHAHDKAALAEALRTPAAYIGMIGSLPKRDSVYKRLLAEGFTQADLDRVKSPIGLDIAAETPEEIAVSIVAELIDCRARRRP